MTWATAVADRATRRKLQLDLTLFRTLWLRDFSAQYRRATFGVGWAVIQPVFYMTIFVGLRLFLTIPSDGLPYPVFVFSALMPWLFFVNAVNRAAASIVSNADIVKKINVNRLVFPLVAGTLPLVDLAVMATCMLGLMILFGVTLGAHLLWLVPLTALLVAFSIGVGLILCAFGTFVRDVLVALPVTLQALLFASPIVYPVDVVPQSVRAFYLLNPLVGLLESFRSVLGRGTSPDAALLVSPVVATILIWAVAIPLYRRLSKYFADVL